MSDALCARGVASSGLSLWMHTWVRSAGQRGAMRRMHTWYVCFKPSPTHAPAHMCWRRARMRVAAGLCMPGLPCPQAWSSILGESAGAGAHCSMRTCMQLQERLCACTQKQAGAARIRSVPCAPARGSQVAAIPCAPARGSQVAPTAAQMLRRGSTNCRAVAMQR